MSQFVEVAMWHDREANDVNRELQVTHGYHKDEQ